MMSILLARTNDGGETLTFSTISEHLKEILSYVPPLISLGADQTRKAMQSAHDGRPIVSRHLYELP